MNTFDCPKCGHTLESVNILQSKCLNADCGLEDKEDILRYMEENDVSSKDMRIGFCG